MKRILQIAGQYPLLTIAVVIILANWQLFLGFATIKWDSSNYWHPWRYFISECYNNGIVPLWNPYTQSGYPVHGDLQGPAYSIDAIVTSFLFKGSAYSIGLIFITYLVFGAYGFYKLCRFMQANANSADKTAGTSVFPALLAGIIYACSGFVTAHGHNLYIVISAGLLPWMYYYYFRMLKEDSVYNSMKFAIIVFFQLTAGNPSFLIVSLYFFVFTYLTFCIAKGIGKQFAEIKKTFFAFVWSGLFSLILCAPVILNVLLIFGDSTRGGGVSLDWAGLENSPWTSLFTFFTPLSGFENGIDGVSRQPIISYYIGASSLFFSVIGFLKFKSYYLRVLGIFAIIAFLLSLGLDTPVFAWCHQFLPFFNVFRMPKLIFIYDIFYLLILFSLGLNYVLNMRTLDRRKIAQYSLIVLLFMAGSVLYFAFAYTDAGTYGRKLEFGSVEKWFWSSKQLLRTWLSAGATCIVLLLFFFFAKGKKWNYLLGFLILFDVLAYYNFTAILRIFGEEKLTSKGTYIRSLPKKFLPPEPISPKEALIMAGRLYPFWMNTAIYLKQPDFTNNNSFALKNHSELEDQHPEDFNYIINKPYVTFVDSVKERINPADTGASIIAVCDPKTIAGIKRLERSKGDTIICNWFKPGSASYTVKNQHRVGFLLQQSSNRFWKIRVNGAEQKPLLAYYSFPLLILEPGTQQISFEYEVPYFHALFVLSLALFGLFIVILVWRFSRYRYVLLTGFAGTAVYCVFSFYHASDTYRQVDATSYAENSKDAYLLYNAKQRVSGAPGVLYNFLYPQDLAAFMQRLPEINNDELVCNTICNYYPPELERVIEARYGTLTSCDETTTGSIRTYKKGTGKEKVIYEIQLPDPNLQKGGVELKPGAEFSRAIKMKLTDFKAQTGDLIVVEAVVESERNDYTGLCFSIESKKGPKLFLADHPLKNNGLRKACCIFYTLPVDFDPKDLAGTSFWNNRPGSVRLRSLTMKVIRKVH